MLDLPVQLPLTSVGPGDWLTLSSFCISAPQTLILSFLQLQLTGIDVNAPYTLAQTGLGVVYVGLYNNYTNYTQAPSNPLEILAVGASTTTPPVFNQRSTTPTIYSATGLYSFVLVSNLTAGNATVSVSGSVRLTFDP